MGIIDDEPFDPFAGEGPVETISNVPGGQILTTSRGVEVELPTTGGRFVRVFRPTIYAAARRALIMRAKAKEEVTD